MPENFARQAIDDVRTELRSLQRKRGKKIVAPLNPVIEFYKKMKINPSELR